MHNWEDYNYDYESSPEEENHIDNSTSGDLDPKDENDDDNIDYSINPCVCKQNPYARNLNGIQIWDSQTQK